VYVTVQLPVVDVRPLVADNTFRDPQPYWPVPARRFSRRSRNHHRSNFVWGLGPVRPRLRGGVAPWLSESSYVDLRRGLRVTTPERFDGWQGTARLAYRNFYTDGIVGRLEVCFFFRARPDKDMPHDRHLLRYAMSAPAWLRGGAGLSAPLVDFGPVFADHLLHATTVGKQVGEWELWLPDWWLQSAQPALIMERPGNADGDAELSQNWRIAEGARVSCWRIDQRGADNEEMRRLRVHVSRLHAGFSAAEVVLGLCVNGMLDPNHPPVERFLIDTLDVLLRPVRHGFSNAHLLGLVVGHARDVYWDTATTLRHALELLDNPKITARVTEYHDLITGAITPGRHEVTVNVKELVMTKYESNISGGTFQGPVNTGSGGAHQYNTGTDAVQLAELLVRLKTAVAELAPTLPPQAAVAAEDAAAGLERAADQAPEERATTGIMARLSSLLEIAANAGGAGTALAAAVTAVRTAFGV
jgi:hypothetical protein